MNKQHFDLSVDLLKVILWQYNDAEKIQQLLTNKQSWYNKNQTDFWNSWIKDVFDLTTANDFGLTVWATILEVPIIAQLEASDSDAPAFSFGELNQNFSNGNFFSDKTASIKLSTKQKRMILRLRYFQLVSKATVPEINQFLKVLFNDAFVMDSYDMSYAIYVFNEEVDSDIKFIIENFDLLPRPAGVGIKTIYRRNDLFGFGCEYQNFENGVFANKIDY